mgnify:CR=1 FL=1
MTYAFRELTRPISNIDGILTSWFKDGIKTLQDIAVKDNKKSSGKKAVNYNNSPKDSFNNYEQRDYDFNALEKKLLGWDNND